MSIVTTNKPTREMTQEELQSKFDETIEFLAKQGKRSLLGHDNIACAYRSKDGCKCAAGIHIPDEYYTKDMERKVVNSGDVWPFVEGFFGQNGAMLISGLQNMHDASKTLEAIKYSAKMVAEQHHLDPGKIELFTTWS